MGTIKITIRLDSDEFAFEGAATFADLVPLVTQWLDARLLKAQLAVEKIAHQIGRSTDRLEQTVKEGE